MQNLQGTLVNDADKLIALGAHSVAGDIMWKNKVLGSVRNGVFVPTDEGSAVLTQDIEDAVVKTEVRLRPRRPRPEPEPEVVVAAPEPEVVAAKPRPVQNPDVHDLLGDE